MMIRLFVKELYSNETSLICQSIHYSLLETVESLTFSEVIGDLD